MKIQLNLSIILMIFISSMNANADIKKIATEFDKGNISHALHLTNDSHYKEIHQFLLSQKFLDTSQKSSFEEITAFLEKHNNWPQYESLATRAENLIHSTTSKTKIIEWFHKHFPKTQNGIYNYYQAALARIKDHKKLEEIIKFTWINYNFSENEKNIFLKKHKDILNQNDHIDKISELLWADKKSEAGKLFYLVDKNYQQVFATWLEILNNSSKAEKLFYKLPGSYKYHPGLLYAYLKLHKKTEPNSQLTNLYLHITKDSKHAKKWWKLQNYYGRELFSQGKYQEAYKIVSNTNLSEPAEIVEANWFAGWLALRYLKAPKKALPHFEKIYSNAKSSFSLSRASYWMGRCYKELKNKELESKWFTEASHFGFTFYGQLAQYELGYKNLKLETNLAVNQQDAKYYKLNPMAQIAAFISFTNKKELLSLYAKEAFYLSKSSGEVKMLYNQISPQLNLHWKVEIAKLAQQAGILLIDQAFPTTYKKINFVEDKVLTHSIIRQESVFDQYAISSANAHGLMQLLPSTAKELASELKVRFNAKNLTANAEYNIKLGSNYLSKLMKQYNHSYILTASHYNAGYVANKWQKSLGEPKKMKLYKAIDFIESIPYCETRTYVHRILENMQVYRYVLDKNKKLRIKEDILN